MHADDLGPLKLKRMASSITELLAPQQKVLVQIMKEPTGNKGPRLTGKVTLPGRYLVLMPYGKGVNLSRRIRNEAERNRLRALGILIKPAGMGLLIRTEAEGVSEEAIIDDLESLQRQWDAIQQEAMASRPPLLLNRDDDFIQKVLRDVYSDDVNRIVTDSESGWARTKKHLTGWSDWQIPTNILIDYHRESIPILEYFRVNAAIREALKPRVDLPSGGYIIIATPEALTVNDVNSGSFTSSATARETVLWTNCEAAVEIARQLRLRNIAGVIVVDFIDMDSRRDQLQVLEQFGKAIRADKSRPQISQLSELGLVELTRKRQGQNIYELFGQPCPTCGGLGHLALLPGEAPNTASQLGSGIARPTGYSSPAQSYSSRPSARDDRSANISPQSEYQELELLNHPSYQDKNGRGGRRRRRRGSESMPSSRSSRNGSPTPIIADRSERNGGDDRRRRRSSRIDERIEKERAEREAQSDSKSAVAETPNRSKRVRNNRRKPEEPPEIVVVEMPPEEQRVYAMMGVSPLVYSEQTVENPQNAEISVVLPGEAEAFMAQAKAATIDRANKRIIEVPDTAETSNSDDAGSGTATDSNALVIDTPNEAEDAAAANSEAAQEEKPSDKPVRRRRRSSRGSADRSSADKGAAKTAPTLKSTESSVASSKGSSASIKTVGVSASDEKEEQSTNSKEQVVRRRRRRRSSANDE